MNVFLCHYGGMIKNSGKVNGLPMMPMLSQWSHIQEEHIRRSKQRTNLNDTDSDLGPDAILCLPAPELMNSPWLQLMLPAAEGCVWKELSSFCNYPLRVLKSVLEYYACSTMIGQWRHQHTAALLTQSMIHKWFFFYCNCWQSPRNEPSLLEKNWSWDKGLAKISGRT